jgi:hypothetical protein
MALPFAPGDDLIFQLESGYGLLRVLVVEPHGAESVWHLLAYEELFPDVETAERALSSADSLHVRAAHLPLTEHAFAKTQVARLGNRPVREEELTAYRAWAARNGAVEDRSATLLLGLR